MKRFKPTILYLLLMLAVVWAITTGVRRVTRATPKADRYDTVGRGDVAIKVTETGTIEPLMKVEVKSKEAGRIAHLYVKEGDRVRAGQVLAEIEPTEINSQVAQIRAQLDGTKARYERAVRGVGYQKDQTRSGIDGARAALRTALAQLKIAGEAYQAQPDLTASEMAQAEAGLRTAEDSRDLLKSSAHPQALVQAQSGYADAQAGEESARLNLDREKQLLVKGFVAQQAFDTARADWASASARLEQARSRRDSIAEQNRLEDADAANRVAQARAALATARANRSQVEIKKQGLDAAQAAVSQARAQLDAAVASRQQDRMRGDDVADARSSVDQLENQLREVEVHQHDTRLIATMDGIVTRRYVEQGELVTSGVSSFSSGTPVLQVADLSRMLVRMSVNEVDVHKVKPGLPVEVTIDGARGHVFHGHVRTVAPAALVSGAEGAAAAPSSGGGGVVRFAVEVLVDGSDPRLKPGMSARGAIVVAHRTNVLRLPLDGVEGSGPRARVRLVTAGGTPPKEIMRNIVTGIRGEAFIEIVSGLRAGDKVRPAAYAGPKRVGIDITNGG